MHKKSPIAIDFDGTIVTHEYPKCGQLVPGALPTIKALQANGHKPFLWTMRSWNPRHRTVLEEAVAFCEDNGIYFSGINQSPQQFSSSKKQYAPIYIDDAAAGCPLCHYKDFVVCDWLRIAQILKNREFITQEQLTEIQNDINEHYQREECPYRPYHQNS